MTPTLAAVLLESRGYRDFLRDMVRYVQSVDPGFSYAQCAYLLGFSSRNAVRDIVDGRRRMTAACLRKLISVCDKSKVPKQLDANVKAPGENIRRCLQLSAEQIRLLEVLVYVDEPDLDPLGRSPALLRRDYDRLRRKLQQRLSPDLSQAKRDELYQSIHWSRVYAALGSEEGASIQEIQQRTGLSVRVISPILQRLIDAALVASRGERFVAVSQNIHLSNLADNEHFKVHFHNALRHALGRSQRHFDDPESLFLALHFSASRGRMADLCQAIKSLVLDFANQNEQPEGDCVVRLTLALTP